jgi:serine/threonine protein kinase
MSRVLIIDDDKELAAMVEEWLLNDKHTVTVKNNGTTGLEALESQPFDLVILDWHMPDMEGIDVLRQFRAKNMSTPVIMLTGNLKIDAKEEGLDSGANDYLTKPFNLRELGARVRAVLRNRPDEKQSLTPLGTNNTEVLQKGNLAGTQLAAKYEFLEVLGEGAWGVVFKARHPYLNKMLAIKMLRPLQMDEVTLNAFHLEGQAISRLDHPNIVTLHDFGITERHQPFMVMEFVDGQSVDEMLDKFSFAPLNVALSIMIQVCDGIAHAHSMGIIHRDLKPANIVVKKDARGQLVPKILDFGLALLAGKGPKGEDTKTIAGSPLYIAPEIAQGGRTDERSDVYSLGCILFELITGNTPITGTSVEEVLENHISATPMRLSEVRGDLNFPALQAVIDKALTKEPAQRFQSAADFKKSLQGLAQTLPSTVP